MQAANRQPQITGGKRLFYFDVLRVFACLSVVMIHTSSSYVMQAVGSAEFWAGHLFETLSRAGVPLFVMISGALMLDEGYSFTRSKWGRHIVKMLLFFVFWSVAYAIVYQVASPLVKYGTVDVSQLIQAIVVGHEHLWFVPMIIGLYLIVPLLRLWVKRENMQYVEYFLMLAVLFAFVLPQCARILSCFDPSLGMIQELLDTLQVKYPVGYSAYFVLGWYLHNEQGRLRKLLCVLGVMGVVLTFAGTYAMLVLTETKDFLFYDAFSFSVLLQAAGMFVLGKSVFGQQNRTGGLFRRVVDLISKYSLGVYAVHVAVIAAAGHLLPQAPAMIAILLLFIVSFAVSLLGSAVLSKLPFFKRFV